MPDLAALVTPPLLLDSTGSPANGDIYVRLTNNVTIGTGIATPTQVQGKIINGQFKALDGAALYIPVTPEGVGAELFVELVEGRPYGQGSSRDRHQLRRVVSVPNVSTVTWDELIDTIPAESGGDVVIPAWVATSQAASDAAVAAAVTATGAKVDAEAAAAAVAPGVANGTATLDSGAHVPETQIPTRLSASSLATSYITVAESPLTPERFGAVGDGTTDDTAAFTAMAVIANGATGMPRIVLREKSYKLTAPINITRAGWEISGQSQVKSRLINSTSAVFTFGAASAASKHYFHDFRASASAGHIFSVTNAAFFQNEMRRLTLDQSGTGFSIFDQTSGDFLDNDFSNLDLVGTTGHTVPLWKVVSAQGGANENTFKRGRSTYSGNYVFWFEETAAGQYTNSNIIRDWNFEIPNGGCIMAKSANGWTIENASVYDLAGFNGGVTTKDLFVLTKSTGPSSRYNAIKRVIRHGGTLGSGLVDIRLGTGNAPLTQIEQCDLSSGSAGFIIDLGINSAVELRGMSASAAFQNRGTQTYQNNGAAMGFFGATPVAKPTITGSRGTESAASTSTRAALVSLGLATDSTTA